MRTKPVILYSGLVIAMLFWALTFVVFKIALESYRPITIILLRLSISVIFLFIFAKALRKLQTLKKKDYKYIIILALFEPFIYFFGESFGLTYVSSTMGAVIISTIPLIVPIGAYFLYRDKLSILNWVGLIVSFGGVLIVVLSSDLEIMAKLKGVLLMFLAVFSAVGYGLTVKKLAHNYNGFTITSYQNLVGIVCILPFFLFLDLKSFLYTIPSQSSVFSIIYLGIFGSSLAFVLFTMAVRDIGPSKANVFANLIPVFTAIFSFFLLKEPMPALKILGIVVVLAGLLLSQIKSVKFNKQKLPAANYQYPA